MQPKERIETQIQDQIKHHRAQAVLCNDNVEMLAKQQREAVAVLNKLPAMADGLGQVIPLFDKRIASHQEAGTDQTIIQETAYCRTLVMGLIQSAKTQMEQARGTITTLESLVGTFKQQAVEHEARARGLEQQGGKAIELAARLDPMAGEIETPPAKGNGVRKAAKKKAAKKKATKKKATKKKATKKATRKGRRASPKR